MYIFEFMSKIPFINLRVCLALHSLNQRHSCKHIKHIGKQAKTSNFPICCFISNNFKK